VVKPPSDHQPTRLLNVAHLWKGQHLHHTCGATGAACCTGAAWEAWDGSGNSLGKMASVRKWGTGDQPPILLIKQEMPQFVVKSLFNNCGH